MDEHQWIQQIDSTINTGDISVLLPLSKISVNPQLSSKFPIKQTQSENSQLIFLYTTFVISSTTDNINKLLSFYSQQYPLYLSQNLNNFTQQLLQESVQLSKQEDNDINKNCRKLIKDTLNRVLTNSLKQNPSWPLTLFTTNLILELVIDLDAIDQGLHVINGQVERFASYEQNPKSDQMKYYYYCGRSFFDTMDFKQSDAFLTRAWKVSMRGMHKKQQLILKYLVISRLIRGSTPSKQLLQNYGLQELEILIQCWKNGDYQGYLSCIEQYCDYFIANGLYTILKYKTTILLYRNFFKSMYFY